jgi:hypothetical protein
MNFVEYGGIQQYGQLLNGWMQYGVLGSEISEAGGGRAKKAMKKPLRKSRDDRDMLDILTMIAGRLN